MVKSQKIKQVASDAIAFLEVLDAVGVVLDADNQVIDQSSLAVQMGLVEYGKLRSADLINLVDEARTNRQSIKKELNFSKN